MVEMLDGAPINSSDNDSCCHVVFLHEKFRDRQEDRYLIDLATGLEKTGHKVTILSSHFARSSEPSNASISLLSSGSWIPSSICGAFRRTLSRAKALCMALRLILYPPAPKPRVVFSDVDTIVLFLLYFFTKYRTIHIQHFPHIQHCDNFYNYLQITSDLVTAKTIGYANEVIVQTKGLHDVFQRSFPKVALHPVVLNPCYDTGLWLEESIDIRRIVADLPNDYHLFVAFGDYKKRSNFKLLLDALEHLFSFMDRAYREQVHVVFAGHCSERSLEQNCHYNDLINMAKAKPFASQITFLKKLPTIHKKTLIDSCTAVIHPTKNDIYPGPILAAMSLGKPIIAINTGFSTTVLTHRISGILVEPDPYKLAMVMNKILTSPNLQVFLGNMAMNIFRNQFCFEAFSRTAQNLVVKGEKF